MAANWSSICGKHKKISNPILVITGTDNNTVPNLFFDYCRKNSWSLARINKIC
jgi:hypothetical protein